MDVLNGLVIDFSLNLLHAVLLGFDLIFDPIGCVGDNCGKKCSEKEHNILDHESSDDKVLPIILAVISEDLKLLRGEDDEADAVDSASN